MAARDFGFTEYETDVLVVGGGLAALRAALSARAEGARVTVAVKRRLGRSGSSANTTGGYAAAISELDAADDPQLHYLDTIVGGGLINERALVRALVDEAPTRIRELWEIGARFRMRDGRYHLSPSGDHSRPRVLVPQNMRGTDVTAPLRDAVLAAGVEVVENCAIVDLLREDDGIVGAVGIRRDRIEGCIFRAGAVVLAAGGAGRLFNLTSNPVDVRGGGFALALRAGARLRDMEFIQFYPWRLIRPFKATRVPIQPSTFMLGGKLYNRNGERFMESYDPERKEAATRDVAARAIFDQIRHGRAVEGGVILDVSEIPDEQFRFENARVVELLAPKGIDYRAIPLIIAPEAHFFMGGVLIDEEGRADLAGLYAAGETAGGVHGGNRLNSNATPETQVFGFRAGRAAAAWARHCRRNAGDPAPILAWRRRLAAVSAGSAEASAAYEALLAEQQEAMTRGIGIVRSGEGLRHAIGAVAAIRERLAALTVGSLGDLAAAAEIDDLCAIGLAAAESALAREESRAAHYREDFPARDPRWQRSITYGPRGLAFGAVATGAEAEEWAQARRERTHSADPSPGGREFVE